MNSDNTVVQLRPNQDVSRRDGHEAAPEAYSRHGGGNSGGDDMQARVAKLESDVEHIKNSLKDIKDDVREIKRDARTDFRLLFGALITVALGLAAMMAKGFQWL